MQLVYYVFITNNRASYHLRWKKNLLKNQKVSKYYGNDCLHLLPFMSLLRAEIFKIRFGHKNIQIKMTYFISIDQVLPRVFQQILPSFNLQIFFFEMNGQKISHLDDLSWPKKSIRHIRSYRTFTKNGIYGF